MGGYASFAICVPMKAEGAGFVHTGVVDRPASLQRPYRQWHRCEKHRSLDMLTCGGQIWPKTPALLLGNQRLHMHRLEQADPLHLRDPTRIVTVRLVDLLRR